MREGCGRCCLGAKGEERSVFSSLHHGYVLGRKLLGCFRMVRCSRGEADDNDENGKADENDGNKNKTEGRKSRSQTHGQRKGEDTAPGSIFVFLSFPLYGAIFRRSFVAFFTWLTLNLHSSLSYPFSLFCFTHAFFAA